MTPVQHLYLELIRITSFGEFDGAKVAEDLEAMQDLWSACIMDREWQTGESDLLKLRDVVRNVWAVNTLFICTTGVGDRKLASLARNQWHSTRIRTLTKKETLDRMGVNKFSGQVLAITWY